MRVGDPSGYERIHVITIASRGLITRYYATSRRRQPCSPGDLCPHQGTQLAQARPATAGPPPHLASIIQELAGRRRACTRFIVFHSDIG
jgi:hypothetical protein